MSELNLHALALEFCAKHKQYDVAGIEAAMNIGAIAATDYAVEEVRQIRQEQQRIRGDARKENTCLLRQIPEATQMDARWG